METNRPEKAGAAFQSVLCQAFQTRRHCPAFQRLPEIGGNSDVGVDQRSRFFVGAPVRRGHLCSPAHSQVVEVSSNIGKP